ncbi:MAG TPA: NUDIX domain-containing protein [Patescibacteria group bacterium]|nr:NUDIX domain-containing protein [Patescibacteria group bacterium]
MTQKKHPPIITGVLGLAVDSQRRFLLTQRHQPKDPEVHEKWQLPGGGMEFGETPEQTLAREMQEELGVSVRILSPYPLVKTHVWNTKRETYHVTLICYLVSIDSQTPTLHDVETKDWRWVTLNEAAELDSLPLTYDFVVEGEKHSQEVLVRTT